MNKCGRLDVTDPFLFPTLGIVGIFALVLPTFFLLVILPFLIITVVTTRSQGGQEVRAKGS